MKKPYDYQLMLENPEAVAAIQRVVTRADLSFRMGPRHNNGDTYEQHQVKTVRYMLNRLDEIFERKMGPLPLNTTHPRNYLTYKEIMEENLVMRREVLAMYNPPLDAHYNRDHIQAELRAPGEPRIVGRFKARELFYRMSAVEERFRELGWAQFRPLEQVRSKRDIQRWKEYQREDQ